jgi:cobalt-zinc-cadmium efflux system membrane fusion protein
MTRTLMAAVMAALALTACNAGSQPKEEHAREGEAHGEEQAEFERGPHQGRMLRDGDFAVELTIFEDGQEPQFRVYPYRKDKPLDPRQVNLTVELTRLGGKVDRFGFTPQGDFLAGQGVVKEPHSFDVKVMAVQGGQRHQWTYASYEGRTTIARSAADAAGVKVEAAGPATLVETIDLQGRVEIVPEGRAEVRAVYPGRIVSMAKSVGDTVRRGETIARVESSYSLQTYAVRAPISGVIVERQGGPGGVAGEPPIYVIADLTQLHAEFLVYPRDAERIQPGQAVEVRSLSGDERRTTRIEALLPTQTLEDPAQIAHVELPASPAWRPGMGVAGSVVVGGVPVPLAVRTKALQRFRDFTVVYARVGDTYEVRMLELGRRTPEWAEVLGGLSPGEIYVADNAFLIRADIEKSGAAHDH